MTNIAQVGLAERLNSIATGPRAQPDPTAIFSLLRRGEGVGGRVKLRQVFWGWDLLWRLNAMPVRILQ